MRKLAVIEQGGHKEKNFIKHQREMFSDVYRLNWIGDLNDKDANCVVKRPIKWSAGRQLMWELIEKHIGPYEYYLFVDDDIIFKCNEDKYIEFLDEWHPIYMTGQRYELSRTIALCNLGKNGKPFRCYGADNDNVLFRRDFLLQMFPYPFHGNGWIEFLPTWILEHTKPEKMFCNPSLVVENHGHRKRGVAHGKMLTDVEKITGLWNKFLKYKCQTGTIVWHADKDWSRPMLKMLGLQAGRNREAERLGFAGISKEYSEFTRSDMESVVNVESKVWKKRESLLPQYEEDIIWRGEI